MTRAVYEYHRKLSLGVPASSGWYEESDSPVPPGPAGSIPSDEKSAASPSGLQQQQQENIFPIWRTCAATRPGTRTSRSTATADAALISFRCPSTRARAGGLIIPPIIAAGTDNNQSVCPGRLWDMAGLQQTLGNWCPGLKVRTTAACRDGENDEGGSTSDKMEARGEAGHVKTVNLPSRSPKGPHYSITTSSTSSSTSSFRKAVDGFLHEASLGAEPIVVRYSDPYLAWDYARSGEMATLRRDLFRALQYNASLLALGHAVHDQMAEATGKGDRFIGVHLIGEDEWSKAGSGGIEALLRGRGVGGNDPSTSGDQIRTVYVSCNDQAAIQKFREMLQPLNYTVYATRTLLKPGDDGNSHQHGNATLLAQVEALGLDHRDVVEYEVLLHARYWLGISTSPLSTLIAHARGDPGIADEEEEATAATDWFEKYVYPHSAKIAAPDGSAARREYARDMVVRGDRFTKLLAVSGDDITDYFP
ncbi:hypothetical protein PG988_003705 [Apiospora saccharicola]